MAYGDLINTYCGISYLTFEDSNERLINGSYILNTYSCGESSGFYEEKVFNYCDSGSCLGALNKTNITGNFCENYYSDGIGQYYSIVVYNSGTVIDIPDENLVNINSNLFNNGYTCCISNGDLSCSLVYNYCTSGFEFTSCFDLNSGTFFYSDGAGYYYNINYAISGSSCESNYLYIPDIDSCVSNGQIEDICLLDGTGYFLRSIFKYCDSGYSFTGATGTDGVGDYCKCYFSDGNGDYYSSLQYCSGVVIEYDKNIIFIYDSPYLNGFNNCISNGSGSFFLENSFCDSGYLFNTFTGQNITGYYCELFYSNGTGSTYQCNYYNSGTFICSEINYLTINEISCSYENGNLNYYFDGIGSCYCLSNYCSGGYIFAVYQNYNFISDGTGAYSSGILNTNSSIKKLTISWDFDEESKKNYFNDAIVATGSDLFLSFTGSKKPFYEINAESNTHLYINDILLSNGWMPPPGSTGMNTGDLVEYKYICKPFIFIKNNGTGDLILHTHSSGFTDNCCYTFKQNQYKGYDLRQPNYGNSCYYDCLLGYNYVNFLIKNGEAVTVCLDNYYLGASKFCTTVEYPFGYFYNFLNVEEINPYAQFPVSKTGNNYYYEYVCDLQYNETCSSLLKSMAFDSHVDSGACLQIVFKKPIVYLTGASYNCCYGTYYSGSEVWNDNIDKLSGFVPDLNLNDCGFCQIPSTYIEYIGNSYFEFFLYESGYSMCETSHWKNRTWYNCALLCCFSQNCNLNFIYRNNQIFSSNILINNISIYDSSGITKINDFKYEKYLFKINSDENICLLYNIDYCGSKFNRYQYQHCYEYPSGISGNFINQNISPNENLKVDLNQTFYNSEVNFKAKINNNIIDLNSCFYSNQAVVETGDYFVILNTNYPFFTLPQEGGYDDPYYYSFIPVSLKFDNYVCSDYEVYAEINFLNKNYLIRDIASDNINLCNSFLPTCENFNYIYCINLEYADFLDGPRPNNYITTINCNNPKYSCLNSIIYPLTINNSESILNTNSIQVKNCNSCSEQFDIVYGTNDCCFFYDCYEFRYRPIVSVFYQNKNYEIEKNCNLILFSGCCYCECINFPSDALSVNKLKIITDSEISNSIKCANICFNFSGINFCKSFENTNNICLNAFKIVCNTGCYIWNMGMPYPCCSGIKYESPNIFIDTTNEIKLKNNIEFYLNPSNCIFNDSFYGLNNFLLLLNSKLNDGYANTVGEYINTCTLINLYDVFDQSPQVYTVDNFVVINDSNCVPDFNSYNFYGYKVAQDLSNIFNYSSGWECLNQYQFDGLNCEQHELLNGVELWGGGYFIDDPQECCTFPVKALAYCFDVSNFLGITSDYNKCIIYSTCRDAFIYAVSLFFQNHKRGYCVSDYLINYGGLYNKSFKDFCYQSNCADEPYGYLSGASVQLVVCDKNLNFNSGILEYGSTDYNSNIINIKNESLKCTGYYLNSNWNLFKINTKTGILNYNYPISYKSISGNAYNYVLPIFNKLILNNSIIHCVSGGLSEYVEFNDRLNYKILQNTLTGYFSFAPYYDEDLQEVIYPDNVYSKNSNYYFEVNNGSFLISKEDVQDSISREINITRCYAYTGIQPIQIESNYLISCICEPIICNNLDLYTPNLNSSFTSGVFYYEYDLYNFCKNYINVISPEMTNINYIFWDESTELKREIFENQTDNNNGIIECNIAQINFNIENLISNNNYYYEFNCINKICINIQGGL